MNCLGALALVLESELTKQQEDVIVADFIEFCLN